MGAEQSKPKGPDLARGVPLGDVADGGMVGGHVGDDAVLLARRGDELFAIGATCSHYNGPLAEGLIVGDTVRCPWHHACFSLRTGEAVAAPAFNPMPCWRVEKTGINIFTIELAAKRLELLRELVPGATRLAVLVTAASAETTVRDVETAARALGLQIQVFSVGAIREIDAAFATLARERPDALFVAGDPFLSGRRVQLVQLAAFHRVPAT